MHRAQGDNRICKEDDKIAITNLYGTRVPSLVLRKGNAADTGDELCAFSIQMSDWSVLLPVVPLPVSSVG